MSTLTFTRDLSRTTLAPPLRAAAFTKAPDHRFLVRELRLHQDTETGEYVIRLADRLNGADSGDDAEQRVAVELDAWRAFHELVRKYLASSAWKRRAA